jgi:aldehyde dehydrogenase (NAD+)
MGAFGSTGQRCTATSRVIVEKAVHGPFVEKLLAAVRQIKVGDGIANPSAMGPVVDMKQYKSVLAAIEAGKAEGATLACGGEPCTAPGGGHFVVPTVFDNVTPEMKLAREEIFGPVLAVIPVDDFDKAIEVANNVEYGLSSSLYTYDMRKVMLYNERIETGMTHVNSPTVGGEAQAPFGGSKATGVGGREMGSTGPQFFCELKTVYIDFNKTVRKTNLY